MHLGIQTTDRTSNRITGKAKPKTNLLAIVSTRKTFLKALKL